MLDRGLRRALRPRASSARRRTRSSASPTTTRRPPPRPARPADVHDRPGDGARTSTTRSPPRPLGDATAGGSGCTSPTSARTCRPGSAIDREAYRRGTSVYVPGRGRADAARGAVQRRLLARARPGPPRGHGRARPATAPRSSAPRSTARDPLRRAARLRPRSTAIFAGERARRGRRGREPLAAARAAAARAARAARARAGALAVETVEPEFAFDARRPRRPAPSATVQTESHRLIEHLMIAANEAVARLLSDRDVPDALPRPRAARARARSSACSTQLASLDVPTPPAPEHHGAAQAADVVAAALAARRRRTCAPRRATAATG